MATGSVRRFGHPLASDHRGRVSDRVAGRSDRGSAVATVIAVAELLGADTIATTDRRDFSITRPVHVPAFTWFPTSTASRAGGGHDLPPQADSASTTAARTGCWPPPRLRRRRSTRRAACHGLLTGPLWTRSWERRPQGRVDLGALRASRTIETTTRVTSPPMPHSRYQQERSSPNGPTDDGVQGPTGCLPGVTQRRVIS